MLGTFSVRSAKAGKLPITLKLRKSALRKVATKTKPATVYIRTITVVPSGLVKQGIPRLSIQAIKVTRDGKLVP